MRNNSDLTSFSFLGKEMPTHDSPEAKRHRLLNPGKGWCLRCGMPWGVVEGHTTWYVNGSGCFPLCEGCWTLLGCGEARIEYYKILVDGWAMYEPVSKETEIAIGKAVANGG